MADETTSTYGILGPSRSHAFALERHRPADDLSDYIERHWVVRWSLPEGETFMQELLAHPCVNVVSAPDRVAVYGMPLKRTRRLLEGSGVAVGTKFRPGAFAAFVSLPAHELVDRSFELPVLFGREAEVLAHELSANPAAHISGFEAFLRSRLPAPDPRRQLLLEIIGDMLSGHASVNVAALADRHGVSPRTLQRLFRDYVGVTPKWVLKRYRVQEAAERIASGEAPDAARLAAELGYFDQPHFIKDFSSQVGCSPRRYAQLCAERESPAARLLRAA